MVNRITFKNFKLFKQKQTLELRPITILIGKNNTGKSAILKLPTMIEGALKSHEAQPLQINNDEVIIGNDFIDLVYGKFGRSLEIEIFQFNEEAEIENKLETHIVINNTTNKPILDYWKLNNEIVLQRIENGIYLNEIDETEYYCEFEGIYLTSYFYKDNSDSSGTHFTQNFKVNTDFIGGIRQKTKEYYDYKSIINSKSGIDGKNLYNFLIEDYLKTDKKYFNLISNWIKQKFEEWELYIDIDSEPYHIELRKGNLKINLSETGMGIGQSLPLIIRAFKPCEEKSIIIVEEPESHLHPFAHAELAQLFADSLKVDKNKSYLFETHSQNFVLRMRKLVAEGLMDKNDLAIYYVDFDEDNNESNLKRILVDDGGGVEWWPEGVFGETSKETRAIYNAQLNDLKNVDRDK